MTFYLALSKATDLAAIAAQAARGERPRHAMAQLADALGAEVVQPDPDARVTAGDRLRARLAGGPGHWALARDLSRRLRPGDAVYCPDEGVGFPVSALCEDRRGPPRVLTCVHNVVRPRAKLALRTLVPARRTCWTAVSRRQTDYLATLGVPADWLMPLSDQTDLRFFTPGDAPPTPRPLVMSVGLEQRDYRTLAAATAEMDLDVAISGFSADARALRHAFPDPMPANMTRGFYEWPDLLALYRRAAVVAVSLAPNSYAAGIQVLLEAIACRRPVVVTRTRGLAEYLDRPDLVTVVPPQDPAAMRAAIAAKLADPAAAAAQAEAAFAHYRGRIDSDAYVAALAGRLRGMAAAGAAAR